MPLRRRVPRHRFGLERLTIVAFPELVDVANNIVDFLNKSASVLACWSCAKNAIEKEGGKTILAFPEFLNVTNNIAEFVNQSAFVFACWSCVCDECC